MQIDTGCYCAKAFDLHVAKLLKHCSQRVYLLRLLRSQGLSTGQLSVVFTGLIVSCLLYALPTWGVFASAADVGKIHALLKRASKRSFFPRDAMHPRYWPWPCVCPSVRLSQVGVLLKRLNVGSHKQHHTIAQAL